VLDEDGGTGGGQHVWERGGNISEHLWIRCEVGSRYPIILTSEVGNYPYILSFELEGTATLVHSAIGVKLIADVNNRRDSEQD